MLRHALVCLLLCLFSTIAVSDTIHVPGDQPTIQAGIDIAAAGDTVLVAAGTYIENIDFKGKEITVISSDGPEVTHIDGSQPSNPDVGSVVVFAQRETNDSVLEGFTLSNGKGTVDAFPSSDRLYSGGGVLCIESSPSIINNTITGNKVDGMGAGIFCYNQASPQIIDNKITMNEAEDDGGGIACYLDSAPYIHDNLITDNVASTAGYGNGGGISCNDHSSPVILDNRILSNRANAGGGIYCYLKSSPEITVNAIKENHADDDGGGICAVVDCDPEIGSNTIRSNTSGSAGGGIYCYSDSSPKINNNLITLNTAEGFGAGIMCSWKCWPEITDNTITENNAGEYGGGIECYDQSKPDIRNNTISKNTALYGGGIGCVKNSSPQISHNRILENEAEKGAGINCEDSSCPNITNNLIEGNIASDTGGGIRCEDTFMNIQIYGNRLALNKANSGAGIWATDCRLVVINCIMCANESDFRGGGLYASFTWLSIINCTIANNTAGANGGGIYYGNGPSTLGGTVTVANSILWGNSADVPQLYVWGGSPMLYVTVTASDIQGGLAAAYIGTQCTLTWGSDVIDKKPYFVNAYGNGDFHLQYTSPCRDAGTLGILWPTGIPEEDIDGNPRQTETMIDMGADEFHTHFYCTGNFWPGSFIQGKLVGYPDTEPLYVMFGLDALEDPYTLKWGDFYLKPPWIFIGPLIPMPQKGVLILSDYIPEFPAAPYDVYMQALIGVDSDSLSKLFVLEVR